MRVHRHYPVTLGWLAGSAALVVLELTRVVHF